MKKIILPILCCTIAFAHQSKALNPSKEYKNTPSKFGMNYKEEKISTKDGATLNAWFFELPKKTTNWIVISGSGDGNMGDELELVNSFISAGYNVCTYDYRGYGKSSDFTIDPDLFIYPQFITDLTTVLDYLRKSRAITKFDLYGQNIGAGLSIGVGAQRPETRKIIADGPWTGLEPMKKRIKEKMNKDVNMPFGYDKNYEPMYAFDKPKGQLKGVLAIVSPQDALITPADLKLIKGITETYTVKESPKNADNFSTDKNVYFEKINKFLAQ
ncbi:MAG: alpha/beta hydrolase [Bacteroidia bacterium]